MKSRWSWAKARIAARTGFLLLATVHFHISTKTRWCLRFFPQKDWEFCFLNNYNAPRYPWFCSGDFKLIPWYVWDDMTGTIVNSINFWVPDSQMLKLFLVNHHSPWSFSIVLCDVSIYPPSCDIKILRGGTCSKSNMAVYLLKRC